MDKFALVGELDLKNHLGRSDVEDLTHAELVFFSICELERDVNNGGFDQYFFNSSGDTAFAVVDALKEIGAYQTARIVADAKAFFPDGEPPRDRIARQVALLALGDERRDEWNELDEQFYDYPDDLADLLYEYIRQNRNEIRNAKRLGF